MLTTDTDPTLEEFEQMSESDKLITLIMRTHRRKQQEIAEKGQRSPYNKRTPRKA
jgi:hypothetical protein